MSLVGGTMLAEDHALGTLELIAHERRQEGLAAEAREARSALASGRFNVAIVGQFKRGKSTLINALVGHDLLPADVAPVTTAITMVEHGAAERATVGFEDGHEEAVGLGDIRGFVCEDENPGNRKGVRVVRVEVPVPLLASGLRLVDTPGVGSVFASNAEVTHSFLRRIDVAVVVLGSDPPISGEELALVRSAAPHVGRMCFVLNKADLVPEMTRVKAEAFTRQVLRDALGEEPWEVIHASALTALRTGVDPGLAVLKRDLSELAAQSGAELALASAARAARHVSARLLQQLDLEQAALVSPLDELDRRMTAFLAAMRDIDDLAIAARARTGAALSYDWRRWELKKEEFTHEARCTIRASLEQELRDIEGASRRQIREEARDRARVQTKLWVDHWHELAQAELSRVRKDWIEASGSEINALIERVAKAASEAFGIPVARFEPEVVEIELRPAAFDFFEQVLFLDPRAVLVPLFDGFSRRNSVAERAVSRITGLTEEWLQRNLYEVDQTMVRWIDTLAKQLNGAIQARLHAVRREVLEAVEAGRRRRAEGEGAVKQELEELRRQRELVLRALGLCCDP